MIPEARRGQRLRACEACHHSKVMCDKAFPCSRCISRRLTCRFPSAPDLVYLRQDAGSSSPGLSNYSAASSDFLRGITNPDTEIILENFTDDQAINENVPELGLSQTEPPDDAPSIMDLDDANFAPWSFVSFMDDELTDSSSFDTMSTSVSELSSSVPAFMPDGLRWLEQISDEIVLELGKSHAFLSSYDPSYSDMFDEELARSVFSSDNLAQFSSAYLRLTHIHFPIIHIPSFGRKDTPAALVLAVAFGGTERSPPRDDTISSRLFATMAEDYIFRYMQRVLVAETSQRPSKKLLYALQAALVMHSVQFVRNNVQIRRRNMTVRLPALISAVRQLGLVRYKHSGAMTWEEFIYDELCIRIGFWTAVTEWHQCSMFVLPPQVSIKEVDGDMPCALELWDAADSEQFEARLSSAGYKRPAECFSSVSKFVGMLMKDKWDGPKRLPVNTLRLSHLRAATMALTSVVVTVHLSNTMSSIGPSLLRAIDRWHTLWNAVTAKIDSETMQKSGIGKHSDEISGLMRKIVQIAITDDDPPPFLKYVGHESLRELYDFILNH